MKMGSKGRWSGLHPGWDDIILHRGNKRLERYRAREKINDFFQALIEDKNSNPHTLE